ncbi:MAG TPA: DinB family protein [Candidatus Binatia bacterium]|nr:DinB family protein [Candidatus Binatia bacterium]
MSARAAPFSYFARLSRRQQTIYLKSDAVAGVALPEPARVRPLARELATALGAGERATVEGAAQRLAIGLVRALDVPPVRVRVLAVRPHAGWGELHGLYEPARRAGAPPLITLWMRTAKQKRIVAFRTFLRTLLHEVGHHLDYTLLGLGESFHTQGFYQRESHLFHQLVTDAEAPPGGPGMASTDEQLARMSRTAADIAAAIKGASDAQLSRRPDERNWSGKEVVCHMRDTEESFMQRLQLVMAMDDPKFLPVEPDRWAAERQYARNDTGEALDAFRVRREESLRFLRELRPEQWERGGRHATRGLMTIRDFVGLISWHDDNHLDQLRRALEGKA